MSETRFHALVPERRLRDGLRLVRRVRGLRLLLLHEGGRTWVLEDRCPHRGVRLARGELDAGHIWCPGHGFRYDLESGQRVQPPVTGGGRECLVRFEVAFRDGRVGVLLPASPGAPRRRCAEEGGSAP